MHIRLHGDFYSLLLNVFLFLPFYLIVFFVFVCLCLSVCRSLYLSTSGCPTRNVLLGGKLWNCFFSFSLFLNCCCRFLFMLNTLCCGSALCQYLFLLLPLHGTIWLLWGLYTVCCHTGSQAPYYSQSFIRKKLANLEATPQNQITFVFKMVLALIDRQV